MSDLNRLAFVDVETTGLDPTIDRIAEIGVVTVDDGVRTEWGTFVVQKRGAEPRAPRAVGGPMPLLPDTAPTFKDIASELAHRLADRRFVAHNARFDYAFLKAEFSRAGIAFDAPVLCTVMLSRRLYPGAASHDLDALIGRHGLVVGDRHRALADARSLSACWLAMAQEKGRANISVAVAELLAGPVLPAHLDPALIDRLPESPGVYVFRGAGGQTLRVGEARNLRWHLTDYFRIDRASAQAMAISHRIETITWHVTQGMLGARLQRIAYANTKLEHARTRARPMLSWRALPDRNPCVELVAIGAGTLSEGSELFGIFDSERKARNALVRLSRRHALCHGVLGIAPTPRTRCVACSDTRLACAEKTERLRHLVKCFVALRPLRVSPWPYRGPVVVRERRDLHVFDEWRHLATVKTESEARETVNVRPGEFDKTVYACLAHRLPKIAPDRMYCVAERDSGYGSPPPGERRDDDRKYTEDDDIASLRS